MSSSRESLSQAATTLIQKSRAPSSGKSTLARLRRPSISGTIIGCDALEASILEPDIIPFDQTAKQAYQLQWALTHDLMQQNIGRVIIDSTCLRWKFWAKNIACS